MSEKKETSLGMYIKADDIMIGDLVSYNKIDIYNKARFEPLPSNKWVVRIIKVKYGKLRVYVRHFELEQLILSDNVDEFKRLLLK